MAQGYLQRPGHTPHQGHLLLVPAGPHGQQERFVQDTLHTLLYGSWSFYLEICIWWTLTELVTAVTHWPQTLGVQG